MRSLILSLFLLGCDGCGSAQQSLSAQASVVAATQPARFDFYQARHATCLAEANIEAYDACMAPAMHVARASDAYRDALFAAQAGVQLSNGFSLDALKAAAQNLVQACVDANVPVPAEVLHLLEVL